MSVMLEERPGVQDRIAARVRELREAEECSLEALAARSGVSRSMLSLIERGETSPTAVVLDRLAGALGVTLASLFDGPESAGEPPSPVSRRKDQVEWQDPGSGYLRRNISPPGVARYLQISEVIFPPRKRVVFETARGERIHRQVWVLEGTMKIAFGHEAYTLRQGDCLAMDLNHPVMFHNPTQKWARYVVVNAVEGAKR